MLVRFKQADKRTVARAFTLAETLVAFCVFGLATGGLMYGYVQVNRMAEWSSMSLAAQSVASQGVEQAFCAQWTAQNDQLTNLMPSKTYTNFTLDIPVTGLPVYVTNTITVTLIQNVPAVRQIRSDCVWPFPPTGNIFTNTAISLRAMDQ